MARANPFDPKVSSVTVQYVTSTATAVAFPVAYGDANQTPAELLVYSPKGTKVQAGTLAAWP